LSSNTRFCRKWHQDYISLVVREDLRDISQVRQVDKIEDLITLLAPRLGSPLSMANLAGELEVAHTTVKNWLTQLKRLYLIFPVRPWSKKITRGLLKERKWYFINWFYAPQGPQRLENMMAVGLLRLCFSLTDMGYGDFHLNFVRTLDKKEIDFIVVRNGRPLFCVEVKSGSTVPTRTLVNRRKWFPDDPTLGIQVVALPGILKKQDDHTWVMGADRFLAMLV